MYGKKCKKGKFYPKNPSKWKNPDNIIYRSGLELNYMRYFDLNPSVIEVSSEEVIIPYIYSMDNKVHRYYMDFYVKVKTNNGSIKKFLIEIKPKKFTQKPVLPKSGRKTKNYLKEVLGFVKNQDKWKYATEYAKKYGMEFIIMTEKDI